MSLLGGQGSQRLLLFPDTMKQSDGIEESPLRFQPVFHLKGDGRVTEKTITGRFLHIPNDSGHPFRSRPKCGRLQIGTVGRLRSE